MEYSASLPPCCCDDREGATARGEFQFIASLDGWCFVDGPRRRMTTVAESFAATRGVETHIGEPFCWHCCPWCGGELPHRREPWNDSEGDE